MDGGGRAQHDDVLHEHILHSLLRAYDLELYPDVRNQLQSVDVMKELIPMKPPQGHHVSCW